MPESPTRFAPAAAAPVTRDRAKQITAAGDQLRDFVAEMVTTIDTLWDENTRLQEGIDTHLEKCAELRGKLGVTEARARTAERLLVSIDPLRIDHELGCPGGAACMCGAIELRARVTAAQVRINEGKHV